ncbi:MAG: gamma-glutamyl-gamma-aminobutyrate hydrolase family protein [Eubacteriales bacterium]|nr:gamma-glutamyl-gamma-aminobutyrate hydrolase family protein [Eubacteriales bacterium]
MKKPMVALCGSIQVDEKRQFVDHVYVNAVQQSGLLCSIFPYQVNEKEIGEYLDCFSGIVLCGGNDVNPKHYGEEPHEKLGKLVDARDTVELLVIKEAMKRKMPILGICRGFQLLNVALGGTLYQDIPSQVQNALQHVCEDVQYNNSHPCIVLENTPAERWFAGEKCKVNTYHHQAVKVLAPGFLPSVTGTDGIIEAYYSPMYTNIIAVQWHPERENNKVTERIFADFVSLCNAYENK